MRSRTWEMKMINYHFGESFKQNRISIIRLRGIEIKRIFLTSSHAAKYISLLVSFICVLYDLLYVGRENNKGCGLCEARHRQASHRT